MGTGAKWGQENYGHLRLGGGRRLAGKAKWGQGRNGDRRTMATFHRRGTDKANKINYRTKEMTCLRTCRSWSRPW